MSLLVHLGDKTYLTMAPQVIHDMEAPQPTVYGENYFNNYKERSDTAVGQCLHDSRREFVETFTPEAKKILDFGCGYGEIVFQDTTGNWFGCDVMPETKQRLGDKFIDDVTSLEEFDAITFWDVLEHLPAPRQLLSTVKAGAYVFISIPCWEDWENLEAIVNWKHYKPGEHVLYCSAQGLIDWLNDDFELIQHDRREEHLGRENIGSFCFKRREHA